MNLTANMRAAIHYIALHTNSVEIGILPLGTIKALERRGLVVSHTSGRYIGSMGHFLTAEGQKMALRIAMENKKAAREESGVPSDGGG